VCVRARVCVVCVCMCVQNTDILNVKAGGIYTYIPPCSKGLRHTEGQ